MPVIKVRDNEPFEVAMKRFKKQCEKAGILSELKRREYYDKPSVRKKKKAAAARKRALKKMRRMARGGRGIGGSHRGRDHPAGPRSRGPRGARRAQRLAQTGRAQLQGAVSVPRREDPLLPRQPRQGHLLLLRLPGRWRRVLVLDEGRE